MNEEQIENLANQVICDGAVLIVSQIHLGIKPNLCEFDINDAIEETAHEHYAQEVLRGFAKSKILCLNSYQSDLIDYTCQRIKKWLNHGYTMEVK